MSLLSLGEQLNNEWGGQGGWGHWICPWQLLSRASRKDHTQEGQPSGMELSLIRGADGGDFPCSVMARLVCECLPQTWDHPVFSWPYLENTLPTSQGCVRSEVGKAMAEVHCPDQSSLGRGKPPARAKELSPTPCVPQSQAALLQFQTGPMVPPVW